MKHIHLGSLLTLTMLMAVTACQEKKSTSSSSSNTVTTTTGSTAGGFTTGTVTGGSTSGGTGGYTTGSLTGGTTSASTTGGSTTGTVTGGASSAYSISVAMSGRGGSCESTNPSSPCDSWFLGMLPSGYQNSDVQVGEFIGVNGSNVGFFAADAYFKVRVTVLPQPQISNTTTGQYCWGRLYPQAQSAYYSKVRYTIGIRDITLRNGTYFIGPRYAMLNPSVNSIAVNGSEIYDFGSRLNTTYQGYDVIGYSVDVSDVMSDSNCQGPSSQCGSLGVSSVKDGMCWNLKLELATDNNRPF